MDVWSRSGERRRLVKGKALSASWQTRVRWRTAFARGRSSYALEQDPSTVRCAASGADARWTEPAPAQGESCSSGRSRLARRLTKTDVCRRPDLTRT